MLHICGVCKTFGEWYQKTNKTEYTNKLTLLAFKIIAILHKTLLATFIKLLETVSKGLFRNRSQNSCHTFLDSHLPFLNLGARRGWVVSTTPRPLYPRERPDTHCTKGCVGPRAGLDVCEKSRRPALSG
jgi:hypothetical protein